MIQRDDHKDFVERASIAFYIQPEIDHAGGT
jgi:hypothetical protein